MHSISMPQARIVTDVIEGRLYASRGSQVFQYAYFMGDREGCDPVEDPCFILVYMTLSRVL